MYGSIIGMKSCLPCRKSQQKGEMFWRNCPIFQLVGDDEETIDRRGDVCKKGGARGIVHSM